MKQLRFETILWKSHKYIRNCLYKGIISYHRVNRFNNKFNNSRIMYYTHIYTSFLYGSLEFPRQFSLLQDGEYRKIPYKKFPKENISSLYGFLLLNIMVPINQTKVTFFSMRFSIYTIQILSMYRQLVFKFKSKTSKASSIPLRNIMKDIGCTVYTNRLLRSKGSI